MKREFLMLGRSLEGKVPSGWWVSEKLDGMRAFWDGGVTRGIPVEDVPFADPHARDIGKVRSTGLWSRRRKVIYAPDWWLESLPNIPLDGELWISGGGFQDVMSVCRSKTKLGWEDVDYKIFHSPPFSTVTGMRRPNWIESFEDGDSLRETYVKLKQILPLDWLVQQYRSFRWDALMYSVVTNGGEGIMITNPESCYVCQRSKNLLKLKREVVGRGKIIGFTDGKGRHEGRIGALIVETDGPNGKLKFRLSGMTDLEREWGVLDEGSLIEFTYRDTTVRGVPKEARFNKVIG